MNMYTRSDYRRKCIAYKTLDLLVNEARKIGVSSITLEATEMGKALYHKYGFMFLKMKWSYLLGNSILSVNSYYLKFI